MVSCFLFCLKYFIFTLILNSMTTVIWKRSNTERKADNYLQEKVIQYRKGEKAAISSHSQVQPELKAEPESPIVTHVNTYTSSLYKYVHTAGHTDHSMDRECTHTNTNKAPIYFPCSYLWWEWSETHNLCGCLQQLGSDIAEAAPGSQSPHHWTREPARPQP